MPVMVAEPDILTKRGKQPLPALKIDVIHCDEPNNLGHLPRVSSDINLSVCIQDAPPSPTQHAEFTLALTPTSHRQKYRCRKQPVVDIHACFDVDDINGVISVIDENNNNNDVADCIEVADKHHHRYERDSIDLLERYEELHPDKVREKEELTHLTSPNQQISHHTRFNLLEHCCIRSASVSLKNSSFVALI